VSGGEDELKTEYMKNQQELRIVQEAIDELHRKAQHKQDLIVGQIDRSRVATEDMNERNEANEVRLAKLALRLKNLEEQLDSLKPNSLDTLVAKSIEVKEDKKELEFAYEQLRLANTLAQQRRDAAKKEQAIEDKIDKHAHEVDAAIANKQHEIAGLQDKVKAKETEKSLQEQVLKHKVDDAAMNRQKEERSRQEEKADELSFASNKHKAELAAGHHDLLGELSYEMSERQAESSLTIKKEEVRDAAQKTADSVLHAQEAEQAVVRLRDEIVSLHGRLEEARKDMNELVKRKRELGEDLKDQRKKIASAKLNIARADDNVEQRKADIKEKTKEVEAQVKSEVQSASAIARGVPASEENEESSRTNQVSSAKSKLKVVLSVMALQP